MPYDTRRHSQTGCANRNELVSNPQIRPARNVASDRTRAANTETPVMPEKAQPVSASKKDGQDARQSQEIIGHLKKTGVLNDPKTCLELMAFFAEHVGYESAGYTTSENVAELILMSARASELAEALATINFD